MGVARDFDLSDQEPALSLIIMVEIAESKAGSIQGWFDYLLGR